MNQIYCCFPGGKCKALTLSYDDGMNADRRLIEIMNRYGIRGTFHLNNCCGDAGHVPAEEIPALYAGHEIACHTANHPTLARCPGTEAAQEILSNRTALEEIAGYPVVGFSYPNRSFSPEIISLLPLLGIRYAREGETTGNFLLPEDLYRWKGTCHHKDHLLDYGREFTEINKPAYLRLMYVWGHSWQFDADHNWDVIEEFCKLAGGRDDIWYCTNLEYADCIENFRRLRFSADNRFVFNPNAASCWITVNGTAVEIPSGQTVRF